MGEQELRELIEAIRAGTMQPDEAIKTLRRLPYVDLGGARIDHHRALRQAVPEAIYAPGKTPAMCAAIVVELLTNGSGPVVLSRASQNQRDTALTAAPAGVSTTTGEHNTVVWRPAPGLEKKVVVISAGTSDLPVARECIATLAAYGLIATELTDCGVAGLHRFLPHVDTIAEADGVVAVAGMEGALASVVGGIARGPVVAVPTSTGYGASLHGVTALLSMLSSCASGISVVGIDNGFGAAVALARMLLVTRS